MSAGLPGRLAEVAGSEGPGPDLDVLWSRGRRRRQRRRVATGLGALAVLVAVVASGVALAGRGGEDEGVVAGPGPSVPVPPAEPTDLPVRMVVEAGPPRDGVPTVGAGDQILVSYLGYDGWIRGVSIDWEAWDGTSWEQTHTLVLGRGPDGSDGQVVPVGDDLMVPAAGMLGPGPDPFPTPSDAGPGWYRACVEVRGDGDGSGLLESDDPPGVSSSVPSPSSEADPTPGSVLDPEAGGGSPSRTIRPCAQLRVADPGGTMVVPSTPSTRPTG